MAPRTINFFNPYWINREVVEDLYKFQDDLANNTFGLKRLSYRHVKGLATGLNVLKQELFNHNINLHHAMSGEKADRIRGHIKQTLYTLRHQLSDVMNEVDKLVQTPKKGRSFDPIAYYKIKGYVVKAGENGGIEIYRHPTSRSIKRQLNLKGKEYALGFTNEISDKVHSRIKEQIAEKTLLEKYYAGLPKPAGRPKRHYVNRGCKREKQQGKYTPPRSKADNIIAIAELPKEKVYDLKRRIRAAVKERQEKRADIFCVDDTVVDLPQQQTVPKSKENKKTKWLKVLIDNSRRSPRKEVANEVNDRMKHVPLDNQYFKGQKLRNAVYSIDRRGFECAPRHAVRKIIGNITHKYPDVLCDYEFEFAAVTDVCFLGGAFGDRIEVNNHVSVLDRNYKLIGLRAFRSPSKDIISGTPVFNRLGQLCSIITVSNGDGLFALTGEPLPYKREYEYASWRHSSNPELVRRGVYVDEEFTLKPNDSQYRIAGDPQAITVIHCNQDSDLLRTHHTYIDVYSKRLLNFPKETDHVTVRNCRLKVNYDKSLVSYSYADGMFIVGKLPTIYSDMDLQCGEPMMVNNTVGSVITKSDGLGNYVVTKFGENFTINSKSADIQIKERRKTYVYGSKEFDTKQELVAYTQNPKGLGKNITIWHTKESTSVHLEENGVEQVRFRFSAPLASKCHSVVSKKQVTRSLELNKVAAELEYLNTRLKTLSMHAKNADTLDRQLYNKPTVVKRKRNTKPKSLTSSMSKMVGLTLLTIFLCFLGFASAGPSPAITPPAGMSAVCREAGAISVDNTPYDQLVKYKTCSTAIDACISTIETVKNRLNPLKNTRSPITCNEARGMDMRLNKVNELCGTMCDGFVNSNAQKPYTDMSHDQLNLRQDALKYVIEFIDVSNDIRYATELMKKLYDCRAKLQHLDAIRHIDNIINITISDCEKELNAISALEEDLTHFRFSSKYHGFGGIGSVKCNTSNWQRNRYLINGAGESCQTGLKSDIEGKNECKKSKENKCYSGLHDECALGHNPVIEQPGKIISASAVKKEKICCTLDCFSKAELYTSLTDQPFCSPYIKAYFGILWHADCHINMPNEPVPVDDLKIYDYVTVFNINGKEFTCRNLYSFELCCNGNGPAAQGGKVDFVDKLCACQMQARGVWGSYLFRLRHTLEQYYSESSMFKIMAVVLGMMLFPRITVIAVLGIVLLPLASGSCEINDMVPLPVYSKQYSSLNFSVPTRVRVTRGDCLDAGDYTLEITQIQRTSQYKFLSSLPYKIKVVCSNFDWGCQLGRAASLDNVIDECEQHCSTGIFYKHTAIQSYFEGSACAILSGIHIKLTACFSAGNLGSEVKVFSRLSTDSGLDFKVIKHSHGIDLASDLRIDDNGTILASEPSRDSNIWPVMVAVRGGDRFCSYDLIDLTRTCHSSDLHDPLKMDSSCLQPVPHWNPDTKRYELSYKNNDFEDMVHVSFEKCPSDMIINIEEYKLKVGIIVNAVTATFQFKRFESGSAIALCNSKPHIRVEKGVLGYHQSTVLILKSANMYRCSVHITIEGCESTQGQLFTLKPATEFITDYWCANNSTGVIAITWNKGSSKVTKEVAKNVLPHIQQLENLLASTYEDSVAVFDFSTVLAALEKLNPVGIITKVYDYFHLNWTKIRTTVFAMVLMYRALLTFDLPLMVLSAFLMFISLATNILACNIYIEPVEPTVFETLRFYINHVVTETYAAIGFRPDIIEDVIVNTSFKIIEQAKETATFIKPKTALSVVKSADWASWIVSIVMFAKWHNIITALGLYPFVILNILYYDSKARNLLVEMIISLKVFILLPTACTRLAG